MSFTTERLTATSGSEINSDKRAVLGLRRPIVVSWISRLSILASGLSATLLALLAVRHPVMTLAASGGVSGAAVSPTSLAGDPFIILAAACSLYFAQFDNRCRRPLLEDMRASLRLFGCAALIDSALLANAGMAGFAWASIPTWGAFFLLFWAVRYTFIRLADGTGLLRMPTVVIGIGDNALSVADALQEDAGVGIKVDYVIDCGTDAGAEQRHVGGTDGQRQDQADEADAKQISK